MQTNSNAWQFQLRRSEQGLPKFSAFKLYRFHFTFKFPIFPPTVEINDSPPRGYFFILIMDAYLFENELEMILSSTRCYYFHKW